MNKGYSGHFSETLEPPRQQILFCLTPLSKGIKRLSKVKREVCQTLCFWKSILSFSYSWFLCKAGSGSNMQQEMKAKYSLWSQFCFDFLHCHQVLQVIKKITKNDLLWWTNDPAFNYLVWQNGVFFIAY